MPHAQPVDEHAGDACRARPRRRFPSRRSTPGSAPRRRLQRRVGGALGPGGVEPPLHRLRARGAAPSRSLTPGCRHRCRERSALRPARPAAPSAAIICASLMAAVVGLQRAAPCASSARICRKVQPSISAHRLQRLVALHHLVEQLARRGAAARSVAAGADPARVARPAEPFVQQPRRRLHAGVDPGLGDVARRRAGLDRHLDASALSGSGRCSHHHAPRAPSNGQHEQRKPLHRRDTHRNRRTWAADDNRRRMSVPRCFRRCRRRCPHWGVIRADGADAATFLQRPADAGHRTAGSDAAPPRRLLLGQGPPAGELRRLAAGSRRVLLACSADVLAATLKRLSMFVLRAHCKLERCERASCRCSALAGSAGSAWPATAPRWPRRSRLGGAQRRSALPDAGGMPRCAVVRRGGAARRQLPRAALRRLGLARGASGCRASSRRRSSSSCRRCSTSSSSAASTSRRAAIRARRSSRAASTAARSSAAPSSSTSTAPAAARRGGVPRRRSAQPAGMVVNAAPSARAAAALLVEVKLAAADARAAPGRRRRPALTGCAALRGPARPDVPLAERQTRARRSRGERRDCTAPVTPMAQRRCANCSSTTASHSDAATARTRCCAMQRSLQARHPQLQARLLCRADDGGERRDAGWKPTPQPAASTTRCWSTRSSAGRVGRSVRSLVGRAPRRELRAMCLVALAIDQQRRFPLVVAANRDEFFDRPTQRAGLVDAGRRRAADPRRAATCSAAAPGSASPPPAGSRC